MNSMAMVLLLNAPSTVCVVGIVTGPMIFNMQLLTNLYLNSDPRVMGPEAQLGCGAVQITIGALFFFDLSHLVNSVAYFCTVVAALSLAKYVLSFAPLFFAAGEKGQRALVQLALFWTSYAFVIGAYATAMISTFEICICGLFIAWDLNGQIVTHYVLQMELPFFNVAPYALVPIGVALEFNFWNPLLELVDSRNNIHLTTLALWAALALKNAAHFRRMALLLQAKTAAAAAAGKKQNNKKKKVRRE